MHCNEDLPHFSLSSANILSVGSALAAEAPGEYSVQSYKPTITPGPFVPAKGTAPLPPLDQSPAQDDRGVMAPRVLIDANHFADVTAA